MLAALTFLLREAVHASMLLIMQPSAAEVRQIVREELKRAAVIILDPLDAYEQENEALEPPK